MPGLTTQDPVTPDRIGRYEVVCAELCGLGHSTMRQNVRVVRAGRVRRLGRRAEAGRERGGGGGGGGERRRRRRPAPTARQLFAVERLRALPHARRRQATGNGRAQTSASSTSADRAPSSSSRSSTRTQVVTKGFQPDIMPQDFGDKLSPEELDALVEYLLEAQE